MNASIEPADISIPFENVRFAPRPVEPIRTPWVVRSLLHEIRGGAEGWSDDLDRAQELPDVQLLALVNVLTRGTTDHRVLNAIDRWHQKLKRARAGISEEDVAPALRAA